MMQQDHERIKELIAAYVLGALPRDEEPSLRAHILTCDDCFAEAESFATATSSLSLAVTPEPPPAGFADRVLSQIAPEASPALQAGKTMRRWSPSWIGAFATMAVAVLVLSIVVVQTRNTERMQQKALNVLVRTGGLALSGPNGAVARVVPQEGGSLFVVSGLPDAPEGHDYQLWLIRDGTPLSAGTFDVSGGLAVIETRSSIQDQDRAAVTLEPDGGSPQPTSDPILSSA